MKFQAVERKNNWEYLTYHLEDGTKLDEKSGGKAHVRWPDGLDMVVDFESVKGQASYTDHGKPSTVTRYTLVINANLHGIPVPVELSDLEVAWVKQ